MSTPGSPNLLLMRQAAAAVPADPFQLPASCRVSEDDTASLKRTFRVAGNRKTWTWSAWIKLGKIGDDGYIFAARSNNNNRIYIKYQSDGTLYGYTGNSNSKQFQTTRKLRDPSAWFHLVWVWDSSNSIERDRQVVWINGERTTNTQNNSYTQDFEGAINDAIGHCICNAVHFNQIFDAYLSDIQFVDGMALHPSCWGEFSSTTGDWNPKAFALQTPNNGTTWSSKVSTDNGSYTSGYEATKAFDGQGMSTWTASANGGTSAYVAVTNLGFTGNSIVRIHTWTTKLELNGNVVYTSSGGDISNSYAITDFDSLKIYGKADGSKPALYYVEVDGVALVDDKTDNSASINDGRVWSTYMSATGGWHSSGAGVPYGPENTFDGNIPNMSMGGMTYGEDTGGTITFAPTGGIVYKDKVELYTDQGSNYTVNGGSSQSFGPATGQTNGTWYTVATGSGTLNTLTWTPQNSSYRPSSAAMRIDGQLMVDGVQSNYGRNGYKLLSDGFSASRIADIGKDYANGLISTANGGKPILTTTDDPNYGDTTAGSVDTTDNNPSGTSVKSSIVFALSGYTIADVHHTVKGSGSAKNITNTDGELSGDESRFYGKSLYLNGTSAKVTTTTDASDFDLSGGTFTIETWFMSREHTSTSKTIFVNKETGTNPQITLGINNSQLFGYTGGTQIFNASAANQVPLDQWCHIAVTRDGTTWRLFVNGVLTEDIDNAVSGSSDGFYLGYASEVGGTPSTRWLKGNYNDVRVYKTACKYTASFTPPIRNDWRAANLHPVPPAAPEIKYFKFRSSYNSTGYACAYSVEYSDNNSSWTEAWSGVATTADGACQLIQGTNGGGSYGTHRYWRFKCGATTNSTHFPRVSRLVLTDSNGIDHLLVKFVDDNCSDSGTIPALNSTYARDFQTSDIVDILTDSPTSYGEGTAGGDVRGNFATLNPLNKHNSADTVTDGNLAFTTSSGGGISESTIAMSSGKYYYEAVFSGGQGNNQFAGIRKAGGKNYDDSYIYVGTGTKYTDGASGTSYGAGLANGDVIGVAFDADNGTLTFYKNGATQGTAFTGITTTAFPYSFITGSWGSSPTYIVNFGQRKFAYTPPTNFLPLCSQNLPTPTIAKPSDHFDVVAWTGTGATIDIHTDFQPDLVWIKNRADDANHMVFDAKRGVQKVIYPNTTTQEQPANISLTHFLSNGFTLSTANEVNGDGDGIVACAWHAPTTFSNSAGTNGATVASSGRYNSNTGFAIVEYIGGGYAANTGVYHPLGVVPKIVLHKRTDGSSNWEFYTTLVDGSYDQFLLNESDDKSDNSQTAPTTTLFNSTWASGQESIAYLWAPVSQFSAMGTYKGNGNADGPMVYTGFRPKWVLIKNATSGGNWNLFDTARSTYNPTGNLLLPNTDDDEFAESPYNDLLSNGFKLRTNDSGQSGSNANQSNDTYIYLAFAESPFSTARAR